ncbi:MAG: class I SAM-dependent methyltransferase [Pseudomonadota bacterium]|nr:class I SAM-dependent methyltransferase [Pseudomonadota bacterium]
MADQAEYWRRALRGHAPEARDVLEIGSFVGGSARLFLTLLPEARIVCVDPFTGDLHGGEAYNGDEATIEQRFDEALAPFPGRVEKMRSRSVPALDALGLEGRRFDVIYIDGSHHHDDILVDSLLAWPLLRVGGLMMWDDYRGGATWPEKARPRHAIEAFLKLHPEHRVVHARYQLYAVKTATPQPLRARLSLARRRLT